MSSGNFFKNFFLDRISFFLFIFLLLSLMLSYIPSSGTFTLLSVQYSVAWNKSGATNKAAVVSHKKRKKGEIKSFFVFVSAHSLFVPTSCVR